MSKEETEFENECIEIINTTADWEKLELKACDQLDKCKGKSFKAFFYLGIALYKMQYFEGAIKAFLQANEVFSKDAQLHYNLGLAYFKLEQYSNSVNHLKSCIHFDPLNFFAYNNLAFLYNMHQHYQEAIVVSTSASMAYENLRKHIQETSAIANSSMEKLQGFDMPRSHQCHRHWAFALFKKGDTGKACKMIKEGIEADPTDADNWVTWGLIMRKVGNYKIAQHKFNKALKLDPENETAKYELELLDRILELDSQITLD